MDWGQTRRKFLAASGVALSALAGCPGSGEEDTPEPTQTEIDEPTTTATETSEPTETAPADAYTTVGAGSFRNTIPDGPGRPPEEPYVADDVSAPLPTNSWWTDLMWSEMGEVLWSHPFAASPGILGLRVGFPQEWTVTDDGPSGPNYAHLAPSSHFTLKHDAVSQFDHSEVTDWTDWSVEYSVVAGENTIDVVQTQGSPFLFTEFSGSGATLAFGDAPEVWADQGNGLGVTIDGAHFGLYAPNGTTWSGLDSADISNDLGDAGYLTIAALPSQSTDVLVAFEEYAYNEITNTEIDWTYDQAASEVRTTYSIETEALEGSGDGTITGLYPHQHKYTDAATLSYEYVSPRGTMKTVEGSSYEIVQPFQGVLPFLPDEGGYSHDTLQGYVDEESAGYRNGPETPADGAYWTGKNFIRMTELAPIAQQIGDEEQATNYLDALNGELEGWFSATDEEGGLSNYDVFYYNEDWGALVAWPAGFGAPAGLNDHHFHYGYFVRAAAEIARNDPEWASQDQWGGMVEELIRDYANPERGHDRYPFLRTFDPYSGHSWAGGSHGAFSHGNNQESSSEAVNAYAAMILWGEYTGNDELRDTGVFLYTQETTAAREYWFDEDDENLPELDDWDYDYACQVWGSGVAWTTWWTDEVEAIYLINVLPVGAYSTYLGLDRAAADAAYSEMMEHDSVPHNYYPGIVPKYRALSDTQDALTVWDEVKGQDAAAGLGESRAHTTHWIHNLDAMGSPDPSVTADHALAHVFDDGGTKTYVAYNPGDSALEVSFSDGTTLSVDPGSMATTSS